MIKKAIVSFLKKMLALLEDNTGKPVAKKRKAPVVNQKKRVYKKRKPRVNSKT